MNKSLLALNNSGMGMMQQNINNTSYGENNNTSFHIQEHINNGADQIDNSIIDYGNDLNLSNI